MSFDQKVAGSNPALAVPQGKILHSQLSAACKFGYDVNWERFRKIHAVRSGKHHTNSSKPHLIHSKRKLCSSTNSILIDPVLISNTLPYACLTHWIDFVSNKHL